MIRISREDSKTIARLVTDGRIDAAMLSTTSLVDDIILSMKQHGIVECMRKGFVDKREENSSVPFQLFLSLAVAAKMRLNTALTDIPFALQDHRTISELGYALWSNKRDLNTGLMSEGTIRAMLDKYSADDFISGYNATVQKHMLPLMNRHPDIHILDCTKLQVNHTNSNYENSSTIRWEDATIRGYKMASIRGLTGDTGVIEDIRLGTLRESDINLSKQMLIDSPCLKEGDILLNDRGFLDRNLINYLKSVRKVDVYVPLRKNMIATELAISIARETNEWKPHPNRKRKTQKICFVPSVGVYWNSDNPENDVELNSCVVWDTETDSHYVFVTTNLDSTATQIIKTYELRPEIEEDYRQLKDFWHLEDFRSKKYHTIAFHIVSVLLGYLFYQLYTLFPEGVKWIGKSFPVICKSYQPKAQNKVVLYSGEVFGLFAIDEIVRLAIECNQFVREKLLAVLKLL